MIIPTFVQDKVVDENGYFTAPWQRLMDDLLQNMQQNLSQEGYVVPSVTIKQRDIIQNGLSTNGDQVAIKGTLLFVRDEVNGGTSDDPMGQLFVLLNDGTFHAVTNT